MFIIKYAIVDNKYGRLSIVTKIMLLRKVVLALRYCNDAVTKYKIGVISIYWGEPIPNTTTTKAKVPPPSLIPEFLEHIFYRTFVLITLYQD